MPKTKSRFMRRFVAFSAFCLGLIVPAVAQYSLSVDSAAPASSDTLGTTYRFYVNAVHETDRLSAVYGSDSSPLVINTPDGIFNAMVWVRPLRACRISSCHFFQRLRTTALPR